MEFTKTEFEGLYLVNPKRVFDNRGIFTKSFEREDVVRAGLDPRLEQIFYSTSSRGVIRGMHFQAPPIECSKIVQVINGEIVDVVLDIRKKSKTFGKTYSRILKGSDKDMLFIPPGFAHGFMALEDNSTVLYMSSRGYSPEHDKGIRYDSFGFSWEGCLGEGRIILSDRDLSFQRLEEFESPF